jgi:hypothetical protein
VCRADGGLEKKGGVHHGMPDRRASIADIMRLLLSAYIANGARA